MQILDEVAASVCMAGSILPWAPDPKKILVSSAQAVAARCLIQFLGNGGKISQVLSALIFSYEASRTVSLIHEVGHFMVAKLLTQVPPKMHFTSSDGGYTVSNLSSLTPFGQRLSKRWTACLITIAGPFLQSLACAVLWASSPLLQSQKWEGYLKTTALLGIISTGMYAVKGLVSTEKTYDFVQLRALGIHPLIAGTICLGLPLGIVIRSRRL